jgi:DNA ligase (NAD+)
MADNSKKYSESELVNLIEKHNQLYWQNGVPEISDDAYDLLVRELESINPNHRLLKQVHTPAVAASGKVKHKKPMLSLDKAYSLEELMTWAAKYARNSDELFLIQPKYDGISANFADGILATRGDGELGENITDKIELIELETEGYKGPLDRPVRGEIIIRNDDFKNLYSKIRRKDGKFYKNSRNAVAGIMGLKDITPMVQQGAKLTLIDYNMVSFSVKLANFAEKWTEILQEVESLPYPMDGLVIKLADQEYSDSLGMTAHHPRGQIAFKFSGVRKETTLLDVDWSFGKNCLTPVALLDPVEIGGVTIKHATLHNIQNIIDRDVHIGDTVTVERAGDVIPYIVESVPGENRKSCIITHCPSCSSELRREGPEIQCINPECPETKVQRLLAAVRSIGIERLGEPNIRRMMQTLGVNSLKDIFDLTVDDILKLEGFKQKSANNLFNEINSARRVEDFKVLAALNIRGVGKNVSKTILEHYTICELRKLNTEQLSEIDGVGPERAEALFCELRKQSESLDELMNAVTILQTKGASAVKRPTICFTGKMPEKRSYYEKLAAERGWEATSSVTKELLTLVANDPAAGGGKLKKAGKLGIEILSLDDWLKKEPVELPAPQEKRQKEGTDEELKTASETKEENERAFSDELPLFDIAQEMEKNDELFENSSEDGFLPGF